MTPERQPESEPTQPVTAVPIERGSQRWSNFLKVGLFSGITLPVWIGILIGTDTLMAQTGLHPEHVVRVLTDLSATFIGTMAVGSIIKQRIGIQ